MFSNVTRNKNNGIFSINKPGIEEVPAARPGLKITRTKGLLQYGGRE
jgi:hypothetical protein